MKTSRKGLLGITSISVIALALSTGCSVSSKKTVNISQPLSVLTSSDKEQVALAEEKIPRSIAILPMMNESGEDIAADLLRAVIQNHFSSKNFQLVTWQEVDRQMAYANNPSTIDPQQTLNTLGVDGVVVGQVKKFQLLHAGIYAEISMTVDLQLINRKNETVWSTSENVTTRAGGVSTTPWGLLLNAATATLHLSEKNMLAAADELGRSLAKQIPQPSGYQGANGPMIEQVLHDGSGQLLNYGDTLKLGLRGEPGQRASISIDGLQSFDLPEVEPGVYLKSVPVSANWNANSAMVTGRLTDNKGVVSTLISSTGLLNFDNTPPRTVTTLMLTTGENGHTLSWENNDPDTQSYAAYLVSQEGKKLLGETRDHALKIDALPAFSDVRIELTSLDAAGNTSTPAVINQRVYPMASVASATVANSNLDASMAGNILLSAAKSPYTLSKKLNIAADQQLFVEPGVEILVTQGGSIDIEGDAWFWGEDMGIKLYATPNQAPKQFMNLHSSGNVTLNNVTFENGDVGITMDSGAATFKGVKFVNNQYNAAIIGGSAAPTFEDCHFEGSMVAGVIVSEYAKPIFRNSVFKNNTPFHVQSSAVYPVAAEGNTWQPAASDRSILGEVRY